MPKEFQVHDTCKREYLRYCSSITSTYRDGNENTAMNYEGSDFEAVKKCLRERVLDLNQPLSMAHVHQMYSDDHAGDTRYHNKLKTRTILQDKDILIKQTASLLLEDITDYMNSLKDMPWPPTIESLTSNDQKMSRSLKLFMDKLLTSPGHDSEIVERLSYTRDFIHGVTRGKVITLKHFLVGKGLHNITGQKLPIQMLSRLGHSVDYNTVCEIETAQAEIALQNAEVNPLNLKPGTENSTVLTVFWADNFNVKIDSDNKMINSIHTVAFQESTSGAAEQQDYILLEKSRKRSIEPIFQEEQNIIANPKKEPLRIDVVVAEEEEEICQIFNVRGLVRHLCENDQNYPNFSGWIILLMQATASAAIKHIYHIYYIFTTIKLTCDRICNDF